MSIIPPALDAQSNSAITGRLTWRRLPARDSEIKGTGPLEHKRNRPFCVKGTGPFVLL